MKKYFWASLLLAISMQAYADLITGRVVGVADGDTITILDNTNTQHKIRLAGIDTPEKNQAFGNVSKKTLSDLIFGKQVTVDWQNHDRYARTVGKVIVNGMDVNLEQIKHGLAWFYNKYQNELPTQDRLEYSVAQDYAKQGRLGLWTDSNPIPPWDYRKQRH
jgi:endonuclease YncB( thermonuclease family)